MSWLEKAQIKTAADKAAEAAADAVADEDQWIADEMLISDRALAMFMDGDRRQVATANEWHDYRKKLRDRVQKDKDGVRQIIGDPSPKGRPKRPGSA